MSSVGLESVAEEEEAGGGTILLGTVTQCSCVMTSTVQPTALRRSEGSRREMRSCEHGSATSQTRVGYVCQRGNKPRKGQKPSLLLFSLRSLTQRAHSAHTSSGQSHTARPDAALDCTGARCLCCSADPRVSQTQAAVDRAAWPTHCMLRVLSVDKASRGLLFPVMSSHIARHFVHSAPLKSAQGLLGNMSGFIASVESKSMYKYVLKMHAQYGPVVALVSPGQKHIVTTNIDFVRRLFDQVRIFLSWKNRQ